MTHYNGLEPTELVSNSITRPLRPPAPGFVQKSQIFLVYTNKNRQYIKPNIVTGIQMEHHTAHKLVTRIATCQSHADEQVRWSPTSRVLCGPC